MMRLVTERLEISDVTVDDVDGLVAVAVSNSAFTMAHEGTDGVPGHYDRSMLERDLAVAALDPGRHPLAIRSRPSEPGLPVVGWAEVLEEHPRDQVPWIGLLEIHADLHRRGYGREAARALTEWARQSGAPAVRLGVDVSNEAGNQFWRASGFVEVGRRQWSGPLGPQPIAVLERRFGPG